jgi:hypothetical protein
MDNMVRIIVIDVYSVFGAEVYDEIIIPATEASDFVKKYADMEKYRIVTV